MGFYGWVSAVGVERRAAMVAGLFVPAVAFPAGALPAPGLPGQPALRAGFAQSLELG